MLSSNNFFVNEGFVNWLSDDISIYFCEFEEGQYTDELYERLGIHFHENLNASVSKRKAEFLAGRFCAIKSLAAFGIKNDTQIDVGEKRCPVWPKGVGGSISHSSRNAIAATFKSSKLSSIGIDIEKLITNEVRNKIQNKILYYNEPDILNINVGKEPLLFTLIFSLKESFFKAAFPLVQEYFDFDAIEVTKVDIKKKTIEYVVRKPPSSYFKINQHLHGSFRFISSDVVVTFASI